MKKFKNSRLSTDSRKLQTLALKESCIRVNYSCWLFSVQAGFDLWHVLQYHLLFFFIAELGIFSQAGWYHSWHLLHSIYFLPSSGIRQLQNTFTSYTTIFSFRIISLWQPGKGLMASCSKQST